MTCGKCLNAITSGKALKAASKFWHENCFRCNDCGLKLSANPDNSIDKVKNGPYKKTCKGRLRFIINLNPTFR